MRRHPVAQTQLGFIYLFIIIAEYLDNEILRESSLLTRRTPDGLLHDQTEFHSIGVCLL